MRNAKSPPPPISLATLPGLTTWEEVDALLKRVHAVPAKKRTDDERILASLEKPLRSLCPRFKASRDSVQKRVLQEFGFQGERGLADQEAKRLFCGFQQVCFFAFGRGWKRHPQHLRHRHFLRTVAKSSNPKSLPGIPKALDDALQRRDGGFFKDLGKAFQRLHPQTDKASLPDLPITLIRNWTNPDCPLWLMTDHAVRQMLHYLTGGLTIERTALKKKLLRLNLQRYHRQPISEALLVEEGSLLRFEGYIYRKNIAAQLMDVVINLPQK